MKSGVNVEYSSLKVLGTLLDCTDKFYYRFPYHNSVVYFVKPSKPTSLLRRGILSKLKSIKLHSRMYFDPEDEQTN